MSEELDIAARYRKQADELRTEATAVQKRTGEIMLKLADDYQRMAVTIEIIDKSYKAIRKPR